MLRCFQKSWQPFLQKFQSILILINTELYLNYAEACVECNDLPEAKKYLNYVRERAGIPKVEVSWAGIAELQLAK